MSLNDDLFILLADDDQDDCLLVEDALEELGVSYKLKCMKNGIELLEYLGDKSNPLPDVVMLDLDMPMKHGLECLDEIRNQMELTSLPIIIYTTHSQPETVKKAHLKKAQYYLKKPNSFKSLVNALQVIIETDWTEMTDPGEEEFYLQG